MTIVLILAAFDAAALLVLLVLVLTAPEATEDERGFRVTGPSWWRRHRSRPRSAPRRRRGTGFPPLAGGTHA